LTRFQITRVVTGRPSLISRSWSTRLLCGDRDRRGRRCCVHPPWFLGLWRICRPLPNADYAFPTARPFGLTERCAPWVGPDAEAGPLPPPSLASPLESDSILLLGDGDSLTVNVSVCRVAFSISGSRSRRARRRSSTAVTYTPLRALRFLRTVEPAHPWRIALAQARLHLGRLARGVNDVAETQQANGDPSS
jgi:hypothetical protein